MTFPKIAIATALLVPLFITTPTLAQEEELSSEQRYRLCSAFPLNSRCEGYTAPVSLKQRPGEEMVCQLRVGETESAGKCKVKIADDRIMVYQEEGDKLEILDDRRNTQEIQVSVGEVSHLQYRETSETDLAETIGLTFLFGIPGLFMSQPDEFSEISVEFTHETQSLPSIPSVLTLIADRDFGINLRTKLERMTGIEAEILLEDEEDEDEDENTPEELDTQTPEMTDLAILNRLRTM